MTYRNTFWDRMIISIAGLIICMTFSSHALDQKRNFAVIGIKNGAGVTTGQAEIIADRLRIKLFNTGAVNMMERDQMKEIMSEQGFQQSGVCTDDACMVEIGELLGVERLVSGSIGKLGKMFLCNFRVIDVQTAKIIGVVSIDITGGIEEVVGHLPSIAKKLVDTSKIAVKRGELFIDAERPASSVEVDGEMVSGKTPVTLKGIAVGEHTIVVREGAWYGAETVVLAPDEQLKVTIKMQREKGNIEVFTEPSGAQVMIDGKVCGTTPIVVKGIAAGEHVVRVVKEGYSTKENKIVITKGETKNISLQLREAAYVTVKTNIKTAPILINGKSAGKGVIESFEVPPGTVQVKVEVPGYDIFETTLNLSVGEKKVIERKLTSIFGSLCVTSTPESASLVLNDESTGTTPYKNMKQKPGKYRLKLLLEGYKDIVENISIVKGETCTRDFKLEHTRAYLDSVEQFTKGHKKRRQNIRRITFGILAAGCGGAALMFNKIADDRVQEYRIAAEEYDEADSQFNKYKDRYNDARDEADVFMLLRNISIGVAGAWGIGFGLSIFF